MADFIFKPPYFSAPLSRAEQEVENEEKLRSDQAVRVSNSDGQCGVERERERNSDT